MVHVRRFIEGHRDAIIISLLALSIAGAVWNFSQIKSVQHQQGKEQRATAALGHDQCVRSRVFGPPLFDHLARVEAKLHTGALEAKVEWPIGSHKQVDVLAFYRTTIPKTCPK